MANDVKLQEGHPVDENIRPLKVGGVATALETAISGNGAKITGDLEVIGEINPLRTNHVISDDVLLIQTIQSNGSDSSPMRIDVAGILTVDVATALFVNSADSSTIELNNGALTGNPYLKLMNLLDTDDYCKIEVEAAGVTTLSTVDVDGAVAHLTLDVDGDIYLSTAGGQIFFQQNTSTRGYIDTLTSSQIKLVSASNHTIILESSGTGDINLDSGGDIILDSNDGNFIAKKAGTEFSAANSAYAGMILGCTNVFGSGTEGVFVAISTSFANLVWDTDKFALVTFVVPPSNKVKISVQLPYVQTSGQTVYLGLATDDSATTLKAKFEDYVWDVDETDIVGINYSWIVDGSDSGMAGGAWSAGDTQTIYIMAKSTGTIRFYTGGTNTLFKGSVIVEATALPATIGDGSEP